MPCHAWAGVGWRGGESGDQRTLIEIYVVDVVIALNINIVVIPLNNWSCYEYERLDVEREVLRLHQQ